VEAVRRSNIDHLNRGIIYYLTPIGGNLLKTEPPLRIARAGFYIIAANHQTRHNFAILKAFQNLAIRPAVGFTHPAHANYTNTNLSRHG
jgi:hypothetical protein